MVMFMLTNPFTKRVLLVKKAFLLKNALSIFVAKDIMDGF